jgi:hypothetical protein
MTLLWIENKHEENRGVKVLNEIKDNVIFEPKGFLNLTQ